MITISDVDTRKAFDIVNILKSKGYSLSLHSTKSFLERAFLSLVYLKPVKKSLDKESPLLPTEDTTIKSIIDKNYKAILPPKDSFEIALDKERFAKFCEEKGFDAPKLFLEEDVKNFKEFIPLIIKPKSGSGALGIEYIDSLEEFEKLEVDFKEYIIQERLKETREVEGAFFLYHDKKLISFYSHKRLKTYPKSGGVTIHSISTYNEELKKIGERVLQELNWSGFAMIEFIKDGDSYKIIELNPRVWGSMMLSEFCGTNMLENYVWILEGKKPKKDEVKVKKHIRWLIPWDIGYLLKNFYKLDRKDSCYINFSYAPFYSSFLFLLYNVLNPKIIKKLFKKILS
jgi:predicted ATP-grasp superfamily ATP-dependent carboligase